MVEDVGLDGFVISPGLIFAENIDFDRKTIWAGVQISDKAGHLLINRRMFTECRGSAEVGDDEYNARLVIEFLIKVSFLAPRIKIKVSDEETIWLVLQSSKMAK